MLPTPACASIAWGGSARTSAVSPGARMNWAPSDAAAAVPTTNEQNAATTTRTKRAFTGSPFVGLHCALPIVERHETDGTRSESLEQDVCHKTPSEKSAC